MQANRAFFRLLRTALSQACSEDDRRAMTVQSGVKRSGRGDIGDSGKPHLVKGNDLRQ